MMELLISDKRKKDVFISIFQLLKNSSSQINATFDHDFIHIQGMDKSHVCLFDIKLTKKWFDNYKIDEAPLDLCFDTSIFYSMISIKSEEQDLYIKKVSDDTLNIELINSSSKKSDFNKYFTMSLLDYEYEKMGIPETEYDAEISLSSKKMSEMLSQLSNFGIDLNIRCTDDYVDFITKGNSGDMRVNISIDDLSSYSIIEGEEVNLTYSLTYIHKMCITNKLSNEIDLCLSNNCPMKINYNLENESSFVFYMAPKISE